MSHFKLLSIAIAAFGLALHAPRTDAQKYPERPVRLIVPFSAGGGTDLVGRLVAQKYTERWGVSMVVENKSGASGTIGGAFAAKSDPNGYTLVVFPNSITINAAIQKDMPFDLPKDFAAVGMFATSPLVLVVNNSLSARSIPELISYAKANPNKLNYGTAGPGTAPHLAGELLNVMAGIKTEHIPFRSSGDIIPSLLSGEVQMAYTSFDSVVGYVKDGRLRILATLGESRAPSLPELPTIAENGLSGYSVEVWYAIFAPAKTPATVIAQLNSDLRMILQAPGAKDELAHKGLTAAYSSPEALTETVRKDMARWKEVADRIGLKL